MDSDTGDTSGTKKPSYSPHITPNQPRPPQFKDPTLSIWLSRIWLSTFQLTTVAGAAALAKTAVAPLERVKVCSLWFPSSLVSLISGFPHLWFPSSSANDSEAREILRELPPPSSCQKLLHQGLNYRRSMEGMVQRTNLTNGQTMLYT
jgi:hypothetical protein